MTTVDPVQDSTGGDAVVRNLIEWSPALPKEVSGQNFSLGLIYMYLGGCFLGPVLTSTQKDISSMADLDVKLK